MCIYVYMYIYIYRYARLPTCDAQRFPIYKPVIPSHIISGMSWSSGAAVQTAGTIQHRNEYRL